MTNANEIRDIKAKIANWSAPVRPNFDEIEGRYVKIARLSAAAHGTLIHRANLVDDRIWDHLPYGPFGTEDAYQNWVRDVEAGDDPLFYAIFDREKDQWAGVASYLRITPNAGSIEVGHINFSKPLQKTRAATETMYLMMKWAFEAGYRRYEWKCDAANIPSRRAAERLGLSFEGVFRQALVVKGRNRDTAWFAAIDSEWPVLSAAFETWLDAGNFDADGRQIRSLSDLTALVLVTKDPET